MRAADDDSDGQHASRDRQHHAKQSLRSRTLQSSRQHPHQHHRGRQVLQDDCRRHRRLLDGVVVEEIRSRDSKASDQHRVECVARAELQRTRSAEHRQQRKHHHERKRSSALRQHQWRNRRNRLAENVHAAREHGAAKGGGDSPKKSGRGNAGVTRYSSAASIRPMLSVVHFASAAVSCSGSKPIRTSSPITTVGVERLLYFRTSSNTAA